MKEITGCVLACAAQWQDLLLGVVSLANPASYAGYVFIDKTFHWILTQHVILLWW